SPAGGSPRAAVARCFRRYGREATALAPTVLSLPDCSERARLAVRPERALSSQRLRYGVMSLEGQGRQRVIPFAGLARQHRSLGDQLHAALDRAVATDAFILGPEVEAFEGEFADYCRTKRGVGGPSGPPAIDLILMAAGLG